MHVSSVLWDWVAALTGLRTDGGMFLPTYWSVPAWLLAPTGWVPSPTLILTILIAVSLVLCAIFFWRRRPRHMAMACVIWGALFADTPYVILLPPLVWLVWLLSVRFARWVRQADYSARFRAPIGLFVFLFAVSAVLMAAVNLGRFEFTYPPGYVRNAVAALHRDGGVNLRTGRAMDELLNAYVAEIARESSDRQWIFTDGLCDAGIELASGGKLRTLALMGETVDAATWERRGFNRFEDQMALKGGAIALMRAWTVDRPENLTNATFQCGFTFLEREAKDRLVYCGLVMRSRGATGDEDGADENVRRLGERIVAFYREGGHNPTRGGLMRRIRFCAMQWRVARAIRRHALELDRLGRVEQALAETELSEQLDTFNPMAKRAGDSPDSTDLRAFGTLTPREGLVFALSRANYALAKTYARPILKDDPENAEANFAMAMSHLFVKEHEMARYYFEAALKSRPNDPALLNNLAVVELALDRRAEAEQHALKALEAKPGDSAIQNTLRQIRAN